MPGQVYTEIAELANEQYGFVTTEDLRDLGIDPINLVRMAERGHLERRGTGLYRVKLTPTSRLDAYMEATLWPRKVRGIVSHETALDLYELSDVNPSKVHLTLPRAYRIRRDIPSTYRIHHEDLSANQITLLEGIPIVTAQHAIRQSHAAHIGPALIGQAIDHAQQLGHLTTRQANALRTELSVPAGDGVRR